MMMTRLAAPARTVGAFVLFTVAGFVATLALTMSACVLFGYQSLTMLSGSMAPALPTGSVVIDESIRALDARPGDVVTFSDPDHAGRLLTHRLQSIEVEGAIVYMVTRGDANDAAEEWSIPVDGSIGRVKASVPLVGYARSWVNQNTGRTTMFAGLFLMGLWILLDVWLPVPLSQLLRQRRGTRRRRVKSVEGLPVRAAGAAALPGQRS